MISTVPLSEIMERAQEVRSAMEALIQTLGGQVLDVSVDLEDSDPVIPYHLEQRTPRRGAGLLRLAAVDGRRVEFDGELAPKVNRFDRLMSMNWDDLVVKMIGTANG